ncbi:probable L-gulonolactone oxidase 6 [Coffea arabica]|uniref:L-gulonolactone oxidase n=1 Tax=Coffea arabica TaxID=13443 RepID=A0A6P6UYG8_COFAR
MHFHKQIQWQILLAYMIIISFTIFLVRSTPPEDHIRCSSGNTNCTITNSYATFPDRSICHAVDVVYPTTEEELISIVANATFLRRKMKVATSTSHSIPKLICPEGENGLIISTKDLNRTLNIDKSAMTITVEPGMLLRQLINESAMAGLAIPYVPYWWGVTVGGILGTGAHGSSLWGESGSAVHDFVIQLRIVTPVGPDEGYAKVRTLQNGDPELDAARVSLGVLGVISQVTLQLQPMFKRSITLLEKNDSDLADQVSTFGRQHEFADLTWYPSQSKVVYRIDDRVSSGTPGNGVYDFAAFRSAPSQYLAMARSLEESQESRGTSVGGECVTGSACTSPMEMAAYGLTRNGESQESTSDVVGKCVTAAQTLSQLAVAAYGLTNDGMAFNGYPVVGYNNQLQSSGTCLDSLEDALATSCPWDPRIKGLYFFYTAISISLSKTKDFIEDVKKLVALQPEAFCGLDLYIGILMRYVTASTAYLGKDEDVVEFDMIYYRSKDPMSPRIYQDILEEIEQLALFKYGGLPHWGKNKNMAFIGAIKKYKSASEFLKVKRLYDPLGLFSNEWTDQILEVKDGISIVKENCALEGLCICSEDVHCAPQKGYFCRPGKVYQEARVCVHLSYEDGYDWS